MKLAIVGAPGSGKSWLSRELAQHLPELVVVDDAPLASIHSGGFDRVLLMGLDLPDAATPLQREADARLREALDRSGLSYAVVYGQGAQRLQAALRLISPQDGPAPRWRGVCEKCADPDCEFQLFTGLRNSKAAEPPPS